ncbi:endonuclease NucS domain-containing protein [Actinocorallia longicatena]|uniref:Endonuclease NucS C-terminal domain-containing protein n=1 Tax=Actinocorallia longicatena TaxID=111803 RepID=A0ABP6QLE9_9ACTN
MPSVPPKEAQIRAHLAQRLETLEPGLRLVAEEYVLPNAVGTGGRIDILARDQHQMWVVIELKRADKTAREAANEITKYAELLRRNRGLPADRVRTIVVALESQWRELLAPLSNIARDWRHDLRGYSLSIDEITGVPLSAQRVKWLPEPLDQRLTSIHILYLFGQAQDRDRCWERVCKSAAQAHIADLVGVDVTYQVPSETVRYPYGLYLALGRIDPQLGRPRCHQACNHPVLLADEREDWRHPDEYDALCHVTSQVRGGDLESGGPDIFNKLVQDSRWAIGQVRSTGAFSGGLYEDSDFIAALRGNDGEARTLFHASASASVASRWNLLKQDVMNCLVGNQQWTELMAGWLEAVEQGPGEYDVEIHIYNPCDLLGALIHGLPHNIREYRTKAMPERLAELVPMLVAVARPRDEKAEISVLHGSLQWDGNPVAVQREAETVYPEPSTWLSYQYGDVIRQADQRFLSLLGLWYVIDIQILAPDGSGRYKSVYESTFLPSGLDAETVENAGGLHSLFDFIERYAEDLYLTVLPYRLLFGT